MDPPNVGQGFETADEGVAAAICGVFVASFGEDPEASERLLMVDDLKMNLFTVYRPANWPQGKVPIVTWGNGTCAQAEGYGGLLRYIASHGFFVVAANNRFVGDGTAQRKGLDFAFAANGDMQSPYFGKLDTDKVIAMGHSQGGLGTVAASSDARIKAALLFNGGTSAPKPFLAMSGDRDLNTAEGPEAAQSSVLAASQSKVAWLWYHMIPGSGHVTLMTQPERVSPAAVAWAKYILLDDAESKTYFAGPSCKLCNMDAQFRFGQKGIQ
jgi:pimeloyl-ACP methyl ester carboxylesterase